MEKYKCIKVVEAEPQEKDGEAGYKVKYEDGYISWSPKEAFEKGYVKYNDYKERLIFECKELQEKVYKLYNFISDDDKFKKLDEKKQKLLEEQHKVMLHYEDVLIRRLELEGFSNTELYNHLKGGEE